MAHNEQLVYDVGLHQGEDTDFYLKKGYQVVAFEAHPGHVKSCRDRFARELASGQLHIVEGAVAPPTSREKVRFYINNTVSVWGTIDQGWVARNIAAGTNITEVDVERVDIADVLDKFGMPFYIKIDIEGADSLVLEALKRFDDRPQFISCEINAVDPLALTHDIDALSDMGYKQFQLVPQENIGGSLVDAKTLHGEDIVHLFGEGASGVFGEDLPGVWIDREALIGSCRPPFNGWQDIHASLAEINVLNVALNRHATQSSTSAWSSDPDPAVDARVANNGDVFSQKHFHTSFEIGPWWQVDLGGLHFIDKVIIFNRIDCSDRLKRLTILGSDEGRNWSPLLKKVDDSHFYVFATNISGSKPVRFVRVRLDGQNYLHFRECQIFGRSVDCDP